MHEENFFKPLQPTFSHLTLKASYSLTADRGPSSITNSTSIFQAYNPYRPFSSDKESGIALYQTGNDELTYEKKHELNLGIDAGFLNNRINVTFDVYRRNNYDLIGVVTTQGINREVSSYGNVASMKSHGEELSISTTNIKNKDFSWTTNFIYSHAVKRRTSR